MAFTPEQERQYQENRSCMKSAKRNMQRYMWLMFILGAVFFFFSFFLVAKNANNENIHGADKFYSGIDIGAIQIILAIASGVLGYITSCGKRFGAIALLGLYGLGLLRAILTMGSAFGGVNILLLSLGIVINAWVILYPLKDLAFLKTQPGYPLFDLEASQPAHYEAPLYVTARRSSSEMDTLGGPAPAPAAQKASDAAMPAADAAALGITDMMSSIPAPKPQPAPQAAMPSAGIVLENLADQAAPRMLEKQPVQAASADVLLGEMTPESASHLYNPDETALPTPEEVRARLAAMRRQQNGQ